MNTFDVMTRPNDAAAVLDAYAAAVNSATVEADVADVPVDEVDELAAVEAPVAEPEAAAPLVEEPAATESATGSMTRMLELAASSADQLMAEARAEAEELTASAQAEADRLLAEARQEAEQVREESAREREQAEEEIAALRQTGADHQTLMREHLHELLAKVETAAID